MNSTRPHTRVLAAVVLGGGAAAVVAGPATDGTAADRPIVRVAPARPLDVSEPVARAAASIPPPPFDPLDPSRPNPTAPTAASPPFQSAFGRFDSPKPIASSTPAAAASPPFQSAFGGFGGPPSAAPAAPSPPFQSAFGTFQQPMQPVSATTQPPPASKGVGGWMSDRWNAMRTAVTGPTTPPPAPKVGQPPPAPLTAPSPSGWDAYPPFVSPEAKPPQPQPQPQPPAAAAKPNPVPPAPPAAVPFRGLTAAGQPGYAGNPAYRWYGWGSTVPGANPFAPGGEYPAGSSQWYALSGATPGAFPVPVTNAFRPPPNGDPPIYVAATPPPGPRLPAMPPGPRPIAESSPPRAMVSAPRPTAEAHWQPASGPRPVSPGFAPPPPTVAPPSDPRWTPADPIFRGQSGN